jgi:thymidylate synthase (FAD)
LGNGCFVQLQEVMGSDAVIADSARTTFNRNQSGHQKATPRDARLINHLMAWNHTSPFEMGEMRFLIKLPIFVARQWVRHRTASLNEFSARYSIMPEEFYIPSVERICEQHDTNRQMSGDPLPMETAEELQKIMTASCKQAFMAYERLLAAGVARETARTILPTNTLTKWMWKCDLHNIFHFLKLRLPADAQPEIRAFATAIAYFVRQEFPVSWEAFLAANPDLVPVIPELLRGPTSEGDRLHEIRVGTGT